MTHSIYYETGKKKVFACAVEWPGWCRLGADSVSALQALVDYAPRYARVLAGSGLDFAAPQDTSELEVVARVEGGAATDFGVPEAILAEDRAPMTVAALEREITILDASYAALAAAAESALGKALRKGPRGGGRALEGILEHVVGAQYGYLNRINQKVAPAEGGDLFEALKQARQDAREGLRAAARDGIPESGPRGGKMWPERYFVRRSAWHVLDHVWEIEDRILVEK